LDVDVGVQIKDERNDMKKALSIVAGVIAGGITVGIVESLGHLIWPPPAGTDITNPEELAAIMHTIPTAALIAVLVAWACGAWVGGLTTGIISKDPSHLPSILTGAVLMTLGIITMITIPHPIWMWILGIALPIPAAFYGAKVVSRLATK
jgi:hypothetical protein